MLDPPRAGTVSGRGSSGKAQVLLTAEPSAQPQNQSLRMNDRENEQTHLKEILQNRTVKVTARDQMGFQRNVRF